MIEEKFKIQVARRWIQNMAPAGREPFETVNDGARAYGPGMPDLSSVAQALRRQQGACALLMGLGHEARAISAPRQGR
jgi:hypothetical protein